MPYEHEQFNSQDLSTSEKRSDFAKAINAAMRGGNGNAPEGPPKPPDTRSATPEAAAAMLAKFEQEQQAYVEALLAKPTSELTGDERAYLGRALREWAKAER